MVTPDSLKVRTLFETIKKLGLSAGQFDHLLTRFLATARFPTWAIGEFLQDVEPPKVYPYSWYLRQIEENKWNNDAIACYLLPDGSHAWGWKHEIGRRLPYYVKEATKPGAHLNDWMEPISEENRMKLVGLREHLEERIEMHVKRRDEVERLKREYDELNEKIEAMEEELEYLRSGQEPPAERPFEHER